MEKKNKKIKQPVSKGFAKVPVVMQMEALECGAASLTMIMHYYRKWIPLEQARVDCGVSMNGANAKNIMLAARSYGMKANAWKIEPESLMEEGPFPCIIHWGFNHFVVLCGFKGKKAVLNDPVGTVVHQYAGSTVFLQHLSCLKFCILTESYFRRCVIFESFHYFPPFFELSKKSIYSIYILP